MIEAGPGTAVVLVQWERARRALEEARTIDEVKLVRDQAEALRLYVRQQGEGLEMQNAIAEIKLRAERRAGELLAQMAKLHGARPADTGSHDESPQPLADLGISHSQSHRWQTEASIPEETFEQHIAEVKAKDDELTSTGLYKLGQKLKQAQEREQTKSNVLEMVGTDEKYRTIVIDPPWPVRKILRDERPNQDMFDYPTMTVKEIAKLPIADLADASGCHVYLWTTHKFLPACFELFEGWGVNYQCLMTWCKNVGFTPFSWMYDTEHVLFGRIGNLKLLKMGLRLSFDASVTKHSEKPTIFYERVIMASPAPRLELFARKSRDGFEVWGNEV